MNPEIDVNEGVSPLGVMARLLDRWRILIGIPAALVIITLGALLAGGVDSRAESVFRPEGAAELSGLAGLAAQFGVGALAAEGDPLAFYTLLATSREILKGAVQQRYEVGSDSLGLIDIYEVDADLPEAERVMAAVRRLEEDVSASANADAGVVTLVVEAEDPGLAIQVNRRLLALLNDFNLRTRSTQASSEREFVEQRLAEARSELLAAETRLAAFLDRNRTYESSPQLRFEAERLDREVRLREQVVTTLAQAYEQARIEQVRTTPLITVLDPPEVNVYTEGVVVPAIMSGIVGFGIALLLVAALEYWAYLGRLYPDDAARIRRAIPRRSAGRGE